MPIPARSGVLIIGAAVMVACCARLKHGDAGRFMVSRSTNVIVQAVPQPTTPGYPDDPRLNLVIDGDGMRRGYYGEICRTHLSPDSPHLITLARCCSPELRLNRRRLNEVGHLNT